MNHSLPLDKLLDDVYCHGYSVIENAIDQQLIGSLLSEAINLKEHFSLAGIGRENELQTNKAIRKDKTLWFDGASAAQTDYLTLLEALRLHINRHCFLGLFDFECHFARYQQGDYYKKHYDAFKGRSNRVFTTICYLNTPASGGELLIYKPRTNQVLTSVKPKAGTFVVFESERFMHEVKTTEDTRYSVAGWFRKNTSTAGLVDPPS